MPDTEGGRGFVYDIGTEWLFSTRNIRFFFVFFVKSGKPYLSSFECPLAYGPNAFNVTNYLTTQYGNRTESMYLRAANPRRSHVTNKPFNNWLCSFLRYCRFRLFSDTAFGSCQISNIVLKIRFHLNTSRHWTPPFVPSGMPLLRALTEVNNFYQREFKSLIRKITMTQTRDGFIRETMLAALLNTETFRPVPVTTIGFVSNMIGSEKSKPKIATCTCDIAADRRWYYGRRIKKPNDVNVRRKRRRSIESHRRKDVQWFFCNEK